MKDVIIPDTFFNDCMDFGSYTAEVKKILGLGDDSEIRMFSDGVLVRENGTIKALSWKGNSFKVHPRKVCTTSGKTVRLNDINFTPCADFNTRRFLTAAINNLISEARDPKGDLIIPCSVELVSYAHYGFKLLKNASNFAEKRGAIIVYFEEE